MQEPSLIVTEGTIPVNPGVLPRFTGEGGRQRLITQLNRQSLLSEPGIAEEIAQVALITSFNTGDEIIRQGSPDNDIYFILSGEVEIIVNGRSIAKRYQDSHIGEMALCDPVAIRSATVKTLKPTVVAKVSEPEFTRIASIYPSLWRGIAIEIAQRLRARSNFIHQPHNEPVVFIGSTREQLSNAEKIRVLLARKPMVVNLWSAGVFRPSLTNIENLFQAIKDSDFAILLVTPDDLVTLREVSSLSPRDNIVFELGLFMVGVGRERTFILKPRGVEVKIPTDLSGLKPIEFNDSRKRNKFVPVCDELAQIILDTGPK